MRFFEECGSLVGDGIQSHILIHDGLPKLPAERLEAHLFILISRNLYYRKIRESVHVYIRCL